MRDGKPFVNPLHLLVEKFGLSGVKKGLEVGWAVTTKGNFFRVYSVMIAIGCPKRRHCVTVYQTSRHYLLEDTNVCEIRNFGIVVPPINIIPFMDMTPYSVVEIYLLLGGMYCLLQGRRYIYPSHLSTDILQIATQSPY